jgi:hypothetical protein
MGINGLVQLGNDLHDSDRPFLFNHTPPSPSAWSASYWRYRFCDDVAVTFISGRINPPCVPLIFDHKLEQYYVTVRSSWLLHDGWWTSQELMLESLLQYQLNCLNIMRLYDMNTKKASEATLLLWSCIYIDKIRQWIFSPTPLWF